MPLVGLDPPVAGFPACSACFYQAHGTPAVCFSCAHGGTAAAPACTCAVCGQALWDGDPCPNTVCHYGDRYFSVLYTVSEQPEQMWTAISRYKYDEDRSWAQVLGRVLVSFLEEHSEDLARFDLITPCALYVGPDAKRLWDHLQLIVEAARQEGSTWPFVDDLIVKSVPTGRFLGIGPAERRAIAEGELRAALSVPDPERVAGRRILVLDDVYSEGFSMREMARALLAAGATEVAGLVFARRKGG